MTTHRQEINRILAIGLLDILFTIAALYLASWVRYLVPWGVRLTWQFVALPWPVYLMTAIIWPIVLSLTTTYNTHARSHDRLSTELRSLLLGVGLALMVLAGALYFSYRQVPRRQFFYFGLIDFSLLALVRLVAYLCRRNGHVPRLLVAGAGKIGQEIGQQIHRHKDWQLIGFLDDDPAKVGTQIAKAPVLDTLDKLEQVVRSQKIDTVIFALPLCAHKRLMTLVLDLEKLPVEASVVPDYFDLAFFRTQIDDSLGLPIIRLRASAIEGNLRLAKRLLDLTIAIPMVMLCLPFLPIVALIIRLDSPGPALFRQSRVGENCHTFHIWKLRTMVQNADELLPKVIQETSNGQIIHKHPDDPRITRVGRFLRRFSLDEFPQLWNVLKGEMSLVGPRPELPWLVERYEGWQRKRFAVPAGITGWWQVSGRSDRPMHLHVEDDLYYIHNYSIWLDLRILWRTIGTVVSRKGAY
jgi:exopolysaccharide biosynthesis polyprenyl glycosylphosphotransferase